MQQRIWSLGRLATSLASVTLATGAGLAATTLFPAGAAAADLERLYRVPESLADRLAGAVFTMTNGPIPPRQPGRRLPRLDDGSLSVAGFFPTGELGSGPAPTSTAFGALVPANADGLGSQGSLILGGPRDCGARLLFAVNAGSNSVACFRVNADGLGRDPERSRPWWPRAGSSRSAWPSAGPGQDVLYVLNSGEPATHRLPVRR